jgi:hypothetical protein
MGNRNPEDALEHGESTPSTWSMGNEESEDAEDMIDGELRIRGQGRWEIADLRRRWRLEDGE